MGIVCTFTGSAFDFAVEEAAVEVFPSETSGADAVTDLLRAVVLAPGSLSMLSSSFFFLISILRRIRATPTYFFLVVGSAFSSLATGAILSWWSSGSSLVGSVVSLVPVEVSALWLASSTSTSTSGFDSVSEAFALLEAADFLPYRRCRAARIRAAFERLSFFSSSSWVISPFTYCIRLFAFSKIRLRRFSAWTRADSMVSSGFSAETFVSSASLSSSTVSTRFVSSLSSAIIYLLLTNNYNTAGIILLLPSVPNLL
mmetsp:Transcript_27477/g.60463  ORF Transcript_27477/g.60463 Transcript_27477/m.60463 type:complete len:257 (+) Transcript_27477:1165-1935(+)